MGKRTIIQVLAGAIAARANSNTIWQNKWEGVIEDIRRNHLPHGSGIGENVIDLEKSTGDCVVISTEFHHMNENGYYDGWTSHTLRISPAFEGITATISGRDRNEIKDYLHEVFTTALEDIAPDDMQWARDAIPVVFGAEVVTMVAGD